MVISVFVESEAGLTLNAFLLHTLIKPISLLFGRPCVSNEVIDCSAEDCRLQESSHGCLAVTSMALTTSSHGDELAAADMRFAIAVRQMEHEHYQ